MQVSFALLAVLILSAYAIGLWRLLRHESPPYLWIVTAFSAVALLLRLIEWGSYPGGLNDDEPKVLYGAIRALRGGDLFGQGPTGLPQLIPVLFEAQLVPLLGAGRWAVRLYSITCSVLSVSATFAVARAMRMRRISSLVSAALVVFLPWSLFYGRISQGGELLFNQLLLLAALSRLIWRDGSWREIWIGALGLWLLFYDYFSGRSMLAMPFVAAALARGRKRLWCLAIAVVALIGFLPQILGGHQYALLGLNPFELHPVYLGNPFDTLLPKLGKSLVALALPIATNAWMTVNSAAVHPWLILALAGLGLFTGVRRTSFLLAGFIVGLMPNALVPGDLFPSAHRMHAAFVFIALAAGASFDLIPWRTMRAVCASAVVVFAAYSSIAFYFSPVFWRAEATWMFNNGDTDLVESIPWNEPRVVEADLGYFIGMRTDLKPERFGVEHLSLPGTGLYALSHRMNPLLRFYESIMKPGTVRSVLGSILIRTNEWDSKQLRGHGWWYEITCGDSKRAAEILTLFHLNYTFSDFLCAGKATHVWRATWRGPAATLRLWFNGDVVIETSPGGTLKGAPQSRVIDFKVEPQAEITIRITGQPNILAALYVVTPQQERLPYWEWVDPLDVAPPPDAKSNVSTDGTRAAIARSNA